MLTVWETFIYDSTFIHWVIPTFIWLFTGIAFIPFTSFYLGKYYNIQNFFYQLFFNVVAFGGILLFSFMASNYYFYYDGKTEIIKAPINGIGHYTRKAGGAPYADVNVKDIDKQIVFYYDSDIVDKKFIIFTLRKGLWGFDVILKKQPSQK